MSEIIKIIPNSNNRYAVTNQGNIISYCSTNGQPPRKLIRGYDQRKELYNELSLIKGDKPVKYYIKDLMWITFNGEFDQSKFFVDYISKKKLLILDNLKLSPIDVTPINSIEDLETINTDPSLLRRKIFIDNLKKMNPDKKEKYLTKLNNFREILDRNSIRNFLYSVGYDDNFIDDNT